MAASTAAVILPARGRQLNLSYRDELTGERSMRPYCFGLISLMVFLMHGACAVPAQDKSIPDDSATIKRDFEELAAEHRARHQTYIQALAAASTAQQRQRIAGDFGAYTLRVIDDMISIAARQPVSSVGREAAIWVVRHGSSDFEPHVRAAEILLEHHADSEALETVYGRLDGFHPVYEKLLRIGATANASQNGRAQATFQLAELLVLRADFGDMMDATPELRSQRVTNMGEQVVEHLESTDRGRDRAAATRLYKRVLREFPSVAYRDQTLGDAAAERLLALEQTYPEIGKLAPNITGKDLRGNPLALEDYRGKVVVISFWASWCASCLDRIPEENQLVAQFANEPFVLLGVNGDATVERAIQAAEEHEIGFTSWWDDPAAEARIVQQYAVGSWPTTFVLDQQGVIRNKNLYGPDLHEAVERLLNE